MKVQRCGMDIISDLRSLRAIGLGNCKFLPEKHFRPQRDLLYPLLANAENIVYSFSQLKFFMVLF